MLKLELQAEEKSFSLTTALPPGDTDSCFVARLKVLATLLNLQEISLLEGRARVGIHLALTLKPS